MSYMERNLEKRLNPCLLLENAKSIISLAFNYYPPKLLKEETFKIAKFAYGKDYHTVIKCKLNSLVEKIKTIVGDFQHRIFVDSAPVLERAWAKRSGLGWIGKNSNLIIPKVGSFVFLSQIILDLELNYDKPFTKNYCENCNRCIEACPTGALKAQYIIDARKCLSYITIELKEEFDIDNVKSLNDNIFGCDICLDICPHNQKIKPHLETEFMPKEKLFTMAKDDWFNLTQEQFSELFSKSAVKRSKFKGLKRNIDFIKKQDTSK